MKLKIQHNSLFYQSRIIRITFFFLNSSYFDVEAYSVGNILVWNLVIYDVWVDSARLTEAEKVICF
jgi:hypothetical protein